VKFYFREGLMPPGRSTSRTSALYDQVHLDRLRLLRVLREVGDVPISKLKEITAVLDAPGSSTLEVLATGVDRLSSPPHETDMPEHHSARQMADAIVEEAGWVCVRPDAPERARLAALLDVVMAFGTHEHGMDVLRHYVRAADQIGKADVGNLDADQTPQGLLGEVVVGQVVFGEILLTLRKLAEEHYAVERFQT
jgi:DNA-binding transcriptional MerR regulator